MRETANKILIGLTLVSLVIVCAIFVFNDTESTTASNDEDATVMEASTDSEESAETIPDGSVDPTAVAQDGTVNPSVAMKDGADGTSAVVPNSSDDTSVAAQNGTASSSAVAKNDTGNPVAAQNSTGSAVPKEESNQGTSGLTTDQSKTPQTKTTQSKAQTDKGGKATSTNGNASNLTGNNVSGSGYNTTNRNNQNSYPAANTKTNGLSMDTGKQQGNVTASKVTDPKVNNSPIKQDAAEQESVASSKKSSDIDQEGDVAVAIASPIVDPANEKVVIENGKIVEFILDGEEQHGSNPASVEVILKPSEDSTSDNEDTLEPENTTELENTGDPEDTAEPENTVDLDNTVDSEAVSDIENVSDTATSDNTQAVEVDATVGQPEDSELVETLPEDTEFGDDQEEDVELDEPIPDDTEFFDDQVEEEEFDESLSDDTEFFDDQVEDEEFDDLLSDDAEFGEVTDEEYSDEFYEDNGNPVQLDSEQIMLALSNSLIAKSGTFISFFDGTGYANCSGSNHTNCFSISTDVGDNMLGYGMQFVQFDLNGLNDFRTLLLTICGESGAYGEMEVSIFIDRDMEGSPDLYYYFDECTVPETAEININGASFIYILVNNLADHENSMVFYDLEVI